MKNLVILISGRGSNMEAIVRAHIPGARISAVISNRPDAAGLTFARNNEIAAEALDHRDFPDRDAFDAALAAAIDRYAPDLVILAGFMRVLGSDFVKHYEGRMINIHPSLLPSFPGLHTHRRALESGAMLHGATVHFVTNDLDCGPIIVQAAVSVSPNDDESALAARVLEQEHRIYPQAVKWFVDGRICLSGQRAIVAESGVSPIGYTSPELEI